MLSRASAWIVSIIGGSAVVFALLGESMGLAAVGTVLGFALAAIAVYLGQKRIICSETLGSVQLGSLKKKGSIDDGHRRVVVDVEQRPRREIGVALILHSIGEIDRVRRVVRGKDSEEHILDSDEVIVIP